MPHYKYPRPAVTVDIVVFGVDSLDEEGRIRVLLIKRKNPPFKGLPALPGGFLNLQESLDNAAFRELKEETGIRPSYLEQLYTFGEPKRDPRERVVSVAYIALVRPSDHTVIAGSDAADATWYDINELAKKPTLKLAFDHAEILRLALDRLRAKVRYAPIGFDLLPTEFTITQLFNLYQITAGRTLDRGNFQNTVKKYDFLIERGKQKNASHRPAKIYMFNRKKYEDLCRKGIEFKL